MFAKKNKYLHILHSFQVALPTAWAIACCTRKIAGRQELYGVVERFKLFFCEFSLIFFSAPARHLYTLTAPKAAPLNFSDHTLELQMTGMPAEVLRVYSWAECPDGARECTKVVKKKKSKNNLEKKNFARPFFVDDRDKKSAGSKKNSKIISPASKKKKMK